MLKRILSTLLIVLASLAFTGCVQMNSDTTIGKDGSGTATLTMSFSPSVYDAIMEMKELGLDSGQDMEMPALDEIDKSQLEKAGKKYGVKIKKFSRDIGDGRKGLDLAFEFKDLKGLSYVLGQAMGEGGGDNGMGIFDLGDGKYVLRSATYDFPDSGEKEEEKEDSADSYDMGDMDPEKMQKQMEIMGKLMGAIGELEIRMAITVPGDIIESNAPEVDGRTSIWTVDSSNMMSAGQDMEPEIVFSSKGLKLKPIEE